MFKLPSEIPISFCPSSGKWISLFSPNDGKELTSVQYATDSDIQTLLGRLHEAQKSLNQWDAKKRSEILMKASELISQDSERLAWIIVSEGGKPLKDAKIEVKRAQTTLELCGREALEVNNKHIIPMDVTAAGAGHEAYITRRPIGPVLAISAFNHPLNLLAHQVGCALASGCAVVLKPAPATPISAYELRRIFTTLGLPESVFCVVNAEIPQVEKLVTSPSFAYVNFIGSAEVGWKLRQKIAPGVRIGLEHGGQAPAVVTEDADLDLAAKALVKGAFYHAGQVCISTQRIFVHSSRYQDFLERFVSLTSALSVGDARDEKTDVGPLIRTSEVKRIQEWIKEAIQEGAKLILGNQTSHDGRYLSPTILSEVPQKSKVMSQEVFGPLVCINRYENVDELIEYLNESDYQFESCIFSKNEQETEHFSQKIKSMTVVINNHNAFRVDWMPFGGHGKSGLGMGGVKYLVEEMTCLKQVISKI